MSPRSLLVGALILGAGALALGCRPDTTGLATLSVPELDRLLAGEPGTVLCDANNAETRAREGVIPGARLLSNYRDYDPVSELPADKDRNLVFYCHSEWCGAAVTAARRAVAAGHGAVYVLPEGIKGWTSAGRRVERPSDG